MIQNIKKFIMVGMASFALLAPTLAVGVVGGGVASADIKTELCKGADFAAAPDSSKACGTPTDGQSAETGLADIARTITKYFSIIVGAISIIMIIYGGFRYIVSGGDSGKVSSAKNTLIYALVGLIIVALAQLIVRFVVSQADTTTGGF